MRFVVTGASSGIGEACVRRLAAAGHEVLAGVRKDSDAERLRGTRVTPLRIELTDPDSARAAAEEAGAVDGLVNNAGVGLGGPLEFLPIDDLRRQLEINVVGQIAVTQAFLAGIRARRGRIVNIGSIGGKVALPLVGPYAASKFALEALTDSLRRELLHTGVQVAIVRPGAVATPIWDKTDKEAARVREAMPPEAQEVYGHLIDAIAGGTREAAERGIDPDAVAQAVEHALTARKPKTRYLVGSDARQRALLSRLLPDRVFDRAIARQLKSF